ncbi:prefoldin 2 [Xylocopa sonorina]|uniref:prefoldin 2 n=1 Tax=Xylocopa sonorina TaxID=1818115 RepID=UPI00403A7F22
MASDKKSGKSSKGAKTTTEILSEFQILRNEQRATANKLSEMEAELNEHKTVIDTLKNIDPKRKCYRMTGGVLCERTVEDVMPALITNKEQLTKVIDALYEQLTKKGIEINEFKEKHNITIQQVMQQRQTADKDTKETKRSGTGANPLLSNCA